MKNILIVLLFVFSTSVCGQTVTNYSFINGSWGLYVNCDTTDNLQSDLYWADSTLSICIVERGDQHVSKNFHVIEETDMSGIYDLNILLQTIEGYTIHIEGGFMQGVKFVNSVKFYFSGEMVGYLNSPIF